MRVRPAATYLSVLGIALAGYAFAGKGFSYLAVGPVFIGEIMLAFGLLLFLARPNGLPSLSRSATIWLLCAFAMWGALCTIPYIGLYRMDALRDAVIWAYGIFTILVAVYMLFPGHIERAIEAYARLLPWFLLLVSPYLLAARVQDIVVPEWPGSGVPIVFLLPGDAAVHLAGIGAFLLLGLHGRGPQLASARAIYLEMGLWAFWFIGFIATATRARAGMLSVFLALAIAVIFRRPTHRIARMTIFLMAIVSILFLSDLRIDTGQSGRAISMQQIVANLQSIESESGVRHGLEHGTREWRLNWWRDIVGYTLHGPYFWTGKGYGINLATVDGYQVVAENKLRSPHNSHLTVLARSGVPGLVLWIVLQTSFGVAILRAYFRARALGEDWWARVDLWIFAYWVAFLTNAAFSVFLEGPHGGIWFWSLMGFGVAAIARQRRLADPRRG